MIENIEKLVEYQKLVEKHKNKEFCNWHKTDVDDFIQGYYNMQCMILSLITENEKLEKEKKKIKENIDVETIRIKAHYRNAVLINHELEKRIEKLNKYNRFDIIEI